MKKAIRNQTVKITKVAVMEEDSYQIIGYGYLLIRHNGLMRLDVHDLNGDALGDGLVTWKEFGTARMGVESRLIN